MKRILNSKKALILMAGLCLIICCCSCRSNVDLSAQNQKENALKDGYSGYQNGIFGFSVEFPAIWICESESYWYATEEYEGSQDSGVMIYVDSQKENFIRVYGQHGQITTDFVVQSNYKKNELDENRELYVLETDEYYTAQLFFKDNKHISATVNVSAKAYKEHEEEIMTLLKSISY